MPPRSPRASPARATSTATTGGSRSRRSTSSPPTTGSPSPTSSYERKHNDANTEGNRDGSDDNRSWNCGVEGPTERRLGARAARAAATELPRDAAPVAGRADAAGGDERGRTQSGNNNAWNQDNPTSWFDWSSNAWTEELLGFVRRLVQLRRSHPVFRRTDFFGGDPERSVLPDVWWFRPDGRPMAQRDWQNPELRELGVFLNGEELGLTTTAGDPVVDDSFIVLLNATPENTEFRLPPRRFGLEWELELTTVEPDAQGERVPGRAAVELAARSLTLLRRSGSGFSDASSGPFRCGRRPDSWDAAADVAARDRREPQVVDARCRLVLAVHDHARQHDRQRGVAVDRP